MGCCNEVKLGLTEDQKNLHIANIAGFGVTEAEIADLISKYGEPALAVVVEAFRSGFSKAWVLEALSSFGPMMLQWVLSLFNRQKMAMSVTGGLVVGEEVKLMEAGVLQDLLEKYLPILLQTYGQKLIDALVQYLLNMNKTTTS
jgi:hypothetical protein